MWSATLQGLFTRFIWSKNHIQHSTDSKFSVVIHQIDKLACWYIVFHSFKNVKFDDYYKSQVADKCSAAELDYRNSGQNVAE